MLIRQKCSIYHPSQKIDMLLPALSNKTAFNSARLQNMILSILCFLYLITQDNFVSYYLTVADYDTTSDSDSFQTKGEKAVHRENAANLNLVFFPMKLCNFFSFKGQSSDFLHLSKSTHYCVRGRGISIACKLQIRHEYTPF